ncbi:ABC-2 type transporter [Alkaliphilus metalliredigens QYMF]|uniref:ABC-2 type transporter n=1 Tax=Alkaliphilus metalliredigens (strain QYMF) TaxID=293826 RepID=A6TX20_ALKMQ|nr:ABC transporter permease [Alkaliphilus metalliredigens]ABR50738.1 ABC-2 type transporter [Alkaliphilus metalliredigens QYMF]
MKRILSIFKRDMKSSSREFLLFYLMIAPILIAIGLRFFIPSVNMISYQFALDNQIEQGVVETFKEYGSVALLEGREAIEDRVGRVDEVIGVTQDQQGHFIIVLEGNEGEGAQSIAQQIIHRASGDSGAYEVQFSDIGSGKSAFTIYGATSVILIAIMLSGMVIGLNIIEEKEAGTIAALSTTPMKNLEFIIGKSFIGMILPIIETFIILWILNVTEVNFAMITLMVIVSSFVSIILGFLIGVLSNNQIAGIANMKFLFLIASASFLGVVLLPIKQQVFLYWSPVYWTVLGLSNVITHSASWGELGQFSAWIIGLTLIIFGIFRKKIKRGLA